MAKQEAIVQEWLQVRESPSGILEFWEGGTNAPPTTVPEKASVKALGSVFENEFERVKKHPFLPLAEIRSLQLQRLKRLVWHAYETVPFYHHLYREKRVPSG